MSPHPTALATAAVLSATDVGSVLKLVPGPPDMSLCSQSLRRMLGVDLHGLLKRGVLLASIRGHLQGYIGCAYTLAHCGNCDS